MRKNFTTSLLALLVLSIALFSLACSGKKDSDDKKEESSQESEEVTDEGEEESESVPVGPQLRPRGAEGEPQKTLALLVKKGKRQIQGWRSERKDIYEYFNTLGVSEIERVKGLIRKIRNFRFDERPEKLMEAPQKIYDFVDALFKLSEVARKDGEDSVLSHEQMIAEVNTGAKKHRQPNIDAMLAQGNSQIKLADYSALLARNLIDEAIIYSRYGSLEMQDQMRDIFVGLKGRGPADDALQEKLHVLLWMVRTEGIDRPE